MFKKPTMKAPEKLLKKGFRDVKNPKDKALLIQNNLFVSDGSFVSLFWTRVSSLGLIQFSLHTLISHH